MRTYLLTIMLALVSMTYGQITIDNTTYSTTQLVDGVLIPNGSGTTISNIQFSGVYNNSNKYQVGYFSTAGTTLGNMGFTDGVVLSTGNTSQIPLTLGTNPGSVAQMATAYTSCTAGEIRQTGTCATYINDLDVLAGSNNYYNAAILEFDFIPVANSVQFRYVFGSEEYEDNSGFINYQCSSYNDKFGFLISGPGIIGGQGYTNNAINIATLANGAEVGINSVNNGIVGSSGGAPNASNCSNANPSWVQNASTAEFYGTIDGTQLNGNTIILTASRSGLTPGQTYHIKLIVTDVNDATYDAVVYLEAGSFTTQPACTNPAAPTASTIIQPDCTTPTGTIEVTAPLGGNLEYSVDGVSYQSGTTFTGLIPGSYDLTVHEIGTTCYSTVTTVIVDPIPAGPSAPTGSVTVQPDCTIPTGTIVVTAPIGGNITYSVDGTSYQAGTSFSGLIPASYNVTALDTGTGCESTISVLVVDPIPSGPSAPTGSVTVQPDCTIPTGTIVVTAPLGGNLQYSVDGSNYQAGTTFSGLLVGTYDVTVFDTGTGCTSTVTQLTVNPPAGAPNPPAGSVTIQPDCIIPTGTIVITAPLGGNLQYSIDGLNYQAGTTFTGLAVGTYDITVIDTGSGCVSTITQLTVNPPAGPPSIPVVTITQPNCVTTSGTVEITSPTGGTLEYSIDGTTFQVGTTFTGIAPGNYDVTVLDNSTGCVSQTQLIVINPIPTSPVITGAFNFQVDCDNNTAEYEVTAPIGNQYQFVMDGTTQVPSGTYIYTLQGSQVVTLTVTDTTTGCQSAPINFNANDTPDPEVCNPSIDCGELFVPTAFSPNNDQINEGFRVLINPECVEEMTLRVFDRWGELIFETTNPSDSWDGRFRGKELNSTVFVYTLEIKLSNESEVQSLSGNVTLLK